MRVRWLKRLAAVVLIIALVLLSWGMYIPAKAQLAQWLMQAAWQRSLHTGKPVKPWPWADTWPVARLSVPEYDIDQIVLAGDSGAVLAFGPGLHGGTVYPGRAGNSVISAHRDTHFRFLRRLQAGDGLYIETRRGKRLRFEISQIEIVDARRARFPIAQNDAFVTLVTCYPFDALTPHGPLRYVVVARRRPAPGSMSDEGFESEQ